MGVSRSCGGVDLPFISFTCAISFARSIVFTVDYLWNHAFFHGEDGLLPYSAYQ